MAQGRCRSMERIAPISRTLTRPYTVNFSRMPSASNAPTGAPKRHVVNRYCSLCHSARAQPRTPMKAHIARTTGPTTPAFSGKVTTLNANSAGHNAASSKASQRRPFQYGKFGAGARAYNIHMIGSRGQSSCRQRWCLSTRCNRSPLKPTTARTECVRRTVTICSRIARHSRVGGRARLKIASEIRSVGNVVKQLQSGQVGPTALHLRPPNRSVCNSAANARCIMDLDEAPALAGISITCPHCGRVDVDDFELLDLEEMHAVACDACKRQYHLTIAECDHCGEESVLTWTTVPTPEPDQSRYVCSLRQPVLEPCRRHSLRGPRQIGTARTSCAAPTASSSSPCSAFAVAYLSSALCNGTGQRGLSRRSSSVRPAPCTDGATPMAHDSTIH